MIGELMDQDLTPAVFICPNTNHTPAALGPTTQATAANIHSGGHLSYIYLGKGFTSSVAPNVILAYEPLSNHYGNGMNVLFGDGHVEFIHTAEATALIAELTTGHNPPRPPTTAPTH